MTEDLLNEILTELERKGFCVQATDGNLNISTTIAELPISLICKFSDIFPYDFPKIFLSDDTKEKVGSIPHMYTDNSICTFDKGTSMPNFNQPVRLACETVYKAIAILEEGIRKENKWDFLDEFNAYWEVKSNFTANSFIDNLTWCHNIYFCFQDGKNDPMLIADSIEKLQHTYEAINYKTISVEDIHKGLLVPIDKDLRWEIPKSDVDIVHLIEQCSSFGKTYTRFMQSHISDPALILFSQLSDRGTILSGWIHFGPGIPNGFRPKHVNLSVAFAKSDKKGISVSIENCSQQRLYTRGGDGQDTHWNKIAIIGCGSLGSMIADSVKYTGTSHYVLNDNQSLRYENIGRHTQGYSYVGFQKTHALKFALQKHNPNVHAECFNENAHTFIENHCDVLNQCDVIFVAVASLPVEYHICQLISDKRITAPVILLWVEPYVIGGHALVINKNQDLFEEMFDARNMEFKYSLVKNSPGLLKREAGCQSTYMPYSGFYLQMYVSCILDNIVHEIESKKGNHLITWCGRLSSASDYGVELTELASTATDFSIIERRVD